jgi:hypothetical protein
MPLLGAFLLFKEREDVVRIVIASTWVGEIGIGTQMLEIEI